MTVYQFQFRRQATEVWASANPVLAAGEPGVDTTVDRMKIGDGVTPWLSLGWATMSGAEVRRVLEAADVVDAADTPTDAAMALEITKPTSATRQALTSTIAGVVDEALADFTPGSRPFAAVNHGSNAAFPRPVADSVQWVGWVVPNEIDVEKDTLLMISEPPFDIVSSLDWHSLYFADDLIGADASEIESWPARVGTALTPTGAAKPTKVASHENFNNQPVALFADSPMAVAAFPSALPQPYSLFVVARSDNPSTFLVGNGALGATDPAPRLYRSASGDYRLNANATIISSASTASTTRFFEGVLKGAGSYFNINTVRTAATGGAYAHNRLVVGGIGTGLRIAMVGIMRGELTDAQRVDVRAWVAAKYGIAL